MKSESQLNEWQMWKGGSPPAFDGEVEVKLRSGETDEGLVHEFVWTVDDVGADIVAWRPLKSSALDIQVGGTHYKNFEIQPAMFIDRNNIPFLEGCAIKRLCRHMNKNGVEDLLKAKHEIDLIIELRYGKQA